MSTIVADGDAEVRMQQAHAAELAERDRALAEVSIALKHWRAIAQNFIPAATYLRKLPKEALRLHVGMRTTDANFLAQGLSSANTVRAFFGDEPDGPILDWGCGSGRTLNWLVCVGSWESHYHGCDVDAAAIAWLRAAGVPRVAVCGDFPPLPYPDATFGGIFAFSVLTHIHPSLHAAWYRELARVLRPGGRMLLTTQGVNLVELKQIPEPIACELGRQGWAYIPHEGHHKNAALVNEDFTRNAARGVLSIESYKVGGYHNMETFVATKA